MSRTFVALSLFLAALVVFAAPARARYNTPNNEYDLHRGQGGGYELPARQHAPQPLVDTPQQPLVDTPRQPPATSGHPLSDRPGMSLMQVRRIGVPHRRGRIAGAGVCCAKHVREWPASLSAISARGGRPPAFSYSLGQEAAPELGSGMLVMVRRRSGGDSASA
jgi:hypothetical protein